MHWTDIVDGAMYEDAQSAVEMKAPAMKLTMAIEAARDRDFVKSLIPLLAYEPLDKILENAFVAAVLPPLLARHQRSIDILRQRAEEKDGTIFFDITDQDLEGYNKFIPVLPASRFDLQHRLEQEFVPGEGFGRFQPLVKARTHRQSGESLRALRRRGPRPGRRDLIRRHERRRGTQSCAGNRRGVAHAAFESRSEWRSPCACIRKSKIPNTSKAFAR